MTRRLSRVNRGRSEAIAGKYNKYLFIEEFKSTRLLIFSLASAGRARKDG